MKSAKYYRSLAKSPPKYSAQYFLLFWKYFQWFLKYSILLASSKIIALVLHIVRFLNTVFRVPAYLSTWSSRCNFFFPCTTAANLIEYLTVKWGSMRCKHTHVFNPHGRLIKIRHIVLKPSSRSRKLNPYYLQLRSRPY